MSGCVTEKYVKKTQTVPPHELAEETLIQKKSGEYSGTQEPHIPKQEVDTVKDVPAPVRTGSLNGKDADDKYSSSQGPTASKYETELQAGLNLLSQKECNEAIDIFSSLTIRYPEQARVQYLLSFAYDKCGDTRKALKGYKDYIDIPAERSVDMCSFCV